MSVPSVSNVATTDTFETWLNKTNEIATLVRTNIITANSTTGSTTGNAALVGVFSANTIGVVNGLRGGNVSTSAVLTITSNVSVTGALTTLSALTLTGNATNMNVTGNVVATNVTASANVTGLRVVSTGNTYVGSILVVTGNTNLTGVLSVTGNSSFANTIEVKSDLVIDVSSTASLGSNTTAPQTIYSFNKTTYKSAKLVVQTENGVDNQTQEAVVAHDGTNVYISVYGTVTTANSGADELGELSAAVNGSNIDIRMIQNNAGSTCTIVANLIK